VPTFFAPKSSDTDLNNLLLNCLPWLDWMNNGAPNLEILCFTNNWATASTVIRLVGIASGLAVVRSIIVRQYCLFLDWGKGPTISTWMCEKQGLGANFPTGLLVCLLTLAHWQSIQHCAQLALSFAMLGQTNFWHNSFDIACTTGCGILLTAWKTEWQIFPGIYGQGV